MPEMLTGPSVESVFSLWLVPSRITSDLDGLRASQLWENHACRSDRHDSRRPVFCVIVLADWKCRAGCRPHTNIAYMAYINKLGLSYVTKQ